MGLIFKLQLFGQNEYKHQTIKNKATIRSAAKLVTREIIED